MKKQKYFNLLINELNLNYENYAKNEEFIKTAKEMINKINFKNTRIELLEQLKKQTTEKDRYGFFKTNDYLEFWYKQPIDGEWFDMFFDYQGNVEEYDSYLSLVNHWIDYYNVSIIISFTLQKLGIEEKEFYH